MHARFRTCGIFLALCSPAAGQHVYTGQGAGTVVRQVGVGFRGVPLLDGFYFRFGPPLGNPSDTDHHFRYIEAGADRPFVNRLTAGFGDKNSDDSFAYALAFHPRFGATTLGSTGNVLGVREIEFSVPRPDPSSVFVLRGFRVGWADTDHHIERLAIFENAGVLTVALEAGRGGFWLSSVQFKAQVDYAYLPRRMVQRRWTRRGEVRSGGVDQQSAPRGTSVLSAFDLRFTNGDHHIRELGVWTPDDGRVQVFFNDKNADDPFLWTVEGAVLERDRRTGIDRPGSGLEGNPGLEGRERPSVEKCRTRRYRLRRSR